MSDVPGYTETINELAHDCEQRDGMNYYSVSLILRHPNGESHATRPLPIRACCAGSATELGWVRLGPTVCGAVNNELKLQGICVRKEPGTAKEESE